VLVVDDDTRLRELLKSFLSRNGLRVSTAANAAAARQQLDALDFDLIVLDVMMPGDSGLDLTGFRRRLAMARAGLFGALDEEWKEALGIGATLPDEMLGPFLLIARAAREGAEAPGDAALAEVYGTHSLGRVRRLISYMEEQGLLVQRVDLGGKRSIALPRLGWTTAASLPEAAE